MNAHARNPCVFQYTAIAMKPADSVCSHTQRKWHAGSGQGEKGNGNDGMPSAAETARRPQPLCPPINPASPEEAAQ